MKIFKGIYQQYGYRIMEVILVTLFLLVVIDIYSTEKQHQNNLELLKNQREYLRLQKEILYILKK